MMKDEYQVRLECLKLAASRGLVTTALVGQAQEFERYVLTGDAQGVPEDRGERPAAKPAKEASTVPAGSGDASDESKSSNKAGPEPPKRPARSKKS